MYTKYTGIILKKHPLGEADELLTIYTREQGKLRVKAIGVRKIRSKLSGHLQSLNEVEFETALAHRSQAGSGRNLPVLTSVRLVTLNSYFRENLRKFAYALIGVETLYRITPDEEKNSAVYESFANFLKNLGDSLEENLEVKKFQAALLSATGYNLPSPSEAAIDQMLNEVLERAIKSKDFLETL